VPFPARGSVAIRRIDSIDLAHERVEHVAAGTEARIELQRVGGVLPGALSRVDARAEGSLALTWPVPELAKYGVIGSIGRS